MIAIKSVQKAYDQTWKIDPNKFIKAADKELTNLLSSYLKNLR